MPDHIDDLLLPIARAADRVAWDDPAAVRGRGQARARHRAIAAGLAVVLAVGLGAGTAWALGRPDGGALWPTDPDPTASGTPTPSPSPSAPSSSVPPEPSTAPTSEPAPDVPRQFTGTPIPLSAMLQPADMPGYGSDDDQQGDDHGSITMMIYYCGQINYSTAFSDHRTAYHKRSLGRDVQHFVLQQTDRYEAGWAARHMRDLRAVLPKCTKVNLMQNPEYPTTLTVIATDFTGDGSVLVKQVGRNADGDFTQYLAVVRQGDVESTMRITVAGLTDAGARDIVRKAATRLCAATPTC